VIDTAVANREKISDPAGVSVRCATLVPMSHTAAQLQVLVERCEQFRAAQAPKGYHDSLALCVVDSVQSTGVTYTSVVKVVDTYRRYRREQGGDPNVDGVPELLATFDELGGSDSWSQRIGNRNRTSTHADAPLKATAIRDAAVALAVEGIETTAALRKAADDATALAPVEVAWRAVAGQRSGITWHYVQMLAGIEGVKPDRMIVRFVADALELPRRSVTPEFALELLTAAAAQMGMSATDLDHAVWQWQRVRR
jgi:hypothetical protein